jgi:hypothetical protein
MLRHALALLCLALAIEASFPVIGIFTQNKPSYLAASYVKYSLLRVVARDLVLIPTLLDISSQQEPAWYLYFTRQPKTSWMHSLS